ncbi:hypothetical protein [Paenibacillus crassostreae]|uniref:Uncharacterized protein n=1 Tax=Paenibacillus crassostreae TaxID=1763538 RepID=A0A167FY72_9BACL|nr:hypothetical protein [Paenibacillus crassostreae]AOZ93952.1 hypothetical protein LPB68_18350 [Paenibacillus crassostreae]OAB77015.1 hypothetical protein PNBC_06390 [Paenibacillus crassostreae]
MSKRHFSSMQSNSPISQANNSVDRLHQSISQAISHPSEQLVEQVENSLDHAEQAVEAAQGSENTLAIQRTNELLADEIDRLKEINVTD